MAIIRKLLFFYLFATAPLYAQKNHRGFFRKYSTAVQEANEMGQILMIAFYEKSCFLSKQMEQEVYSSKEFQKITDEIACVKMDIDTEEGGKLAEKYQIPGCPTVLFVNGAGLELERISSFVPKSVFLGEVIRLLSGNAIPEIESRVASHPVYSDLFILSVYFCRNDYNKEKLDNYFEAFKKLDPQYLKDSTNKLLQFVYRKQIQRGVGSVAPEMEEYLIMRPEGNNYKLAELLTNYYLKSGDADSAWEFFSDFYLLSERKSKMENYYLQLKKLTGHGDVEEPGKKKY